jgi:ParB-like chromosome segregation protein Spo0J
VSRIRISLLREADSPRLTGESAEHVRSLVESDVPLPPITVHRETLRVVDGMHRLRAAALCGRDFIDVHFVDAEPDDAFVLAVEANVAHGLPLTLADRKAAAARIVRSHPHWSDRAVAAKTGLSHKTVGSLRRCSTGEASRLNTRLGLDGRVRPIGLSPGRQIAAELLAAHPGASLRQIARAAGISPVTVRKVREELRVRDVPTASEPPGSRRSGPPGDRRSVLPLLRADPSVRCTESGRKLLRLLDMHAISVSDWETLTGDIPEHCVDLVADVARSCASKWETFAALLEQRQERKRPGVALERTGG